MSIFDKLFGKRQPEATQYTPDVTPAPTPTTGEDALVHDALVQPNEAVIAVPGLAEAPATNTADVDATEAPVAEVAPGLGGIAVSSTPEVAPAVADVASATEAGITVEPPMVEAVDTSSSDSFAIPELPAVESTKLTPGEAAADATPAGWEIEPTQAAEVAESQAAAPEVPAQPIAPLDTPTQQ